MTVPRRRGMAACRSAQALILIGLAAGTSLGGCRRPPPPQPVAPAPTNPVNIGDSVYCQAFEQGRPVDVYGRVESMQGDEARVTGTDGVAHFARLATCRHDEPAPAAAAAAPPPSFAPGQTVHCRAQAGTDVIEVQGQVQAVQVDQLQVLPAGEAARWVYAQSCRLVETPPPESAPPAASGALSPGQSVYCRVQENDQIVDVRGSVQAAQGDLVQVAVSGGDPRWLYAYSCQATEAPAAAPAAPARSASGLQAGDAVLCRRPGLPQENAAEVVRQSGELVDVRYADGRTETLDQVYCRKRPATASGGAPR